MKVVLASLMLLMAYIAIDCSKISEVKRTDEEVEMEREIDMSLSDQRDQVQDENNKSVQENPEITDVEAEQSESEDGDEIYMSYLNWKAEQPQDSDTSFQRYLESTGTKIEKKKLGFQRYTVDVETGPQKHAGTDARVFIQLLGSRGLSPEIRLNNAFRNDFRRGKTDTFNIDTEAVGDISKIRIRHDNARVSPNWFLNKVNIVDTVRNKMYSFPCYQWLTKDGGDGKISRELLVKYE